jgi:hypothetical protein
MVTKGNASCAEARRIVGRALGNKPGVFHGERLAEGYWIENGWNCHPSQQATGQCAQGPRNRIVMQLTEPWSDKPIAPCLGSATPMEGASRKVRRLVA